MVAFSNEIQTLEVKLKSRDSELADTKKKLGEVTEKYSDLKRRARHYKAHCQSKQVRKFVKSKSADKGHITDIYWSPCRWHSTLSELTLNSVQKSSMVS